MNNLLRKKISYEEEHSIGIVGKCASKYQMNELI